MLFWCLSVAIVSHAESEAIAPVTPKVLTAESNTTEKAIEPISQPQPAIYQWRDEQGHTHYGDEPSKTHASIEISGKIKDSGSIYKFTPVNLESLTSSNSNNDVDQTDNNAPIGVQVQFYANNIVISQQDKKKISAAIQQMYQKYVYWFGWQRQAKKPVKLRIFGNLAEYDKYSPKGAFATLGHRNGYYNSSINECRVYASEINSQAMAIILHEASHNLTHLEVSPSPWIDEGLAMVFGSYNNVVALDGEPVAQEVIKHKLREGSLLPINDYLSIGQYSQWHSSDRVAEKNNYYVAWSMMQFLLNSAKGKQTLRQVFIGTKKGNIRLDAAFQQYYAGGVNKLDADWQAWLAK